MNMRAKIYVVVGSDTTDLTIFKTQVESIMTLIEGLVSEGTIASVERNAETVEVRVNMADV